MMDEYIRNSIEARKKSIDDYYDIPEDMAGEVEAVFAGMYELGESSFDVGDFEAKLATSPINEAYMGLFARLTVRPSVVSDAMKQSVKMRLEDKEQVKEDIADELRYAADRLAQPLRHQAYEARRDWARDNIPGYGTAEQIGNTASVVKKLFGRGKKDDTDI